MKQHTSMEDATFDSPAGSCDGLLLNQRGTAGTAAARPEDSDNAGPKRRTPLLPIRALLGAAARSSPLRRVVHHRRRVRRRRHSPAGGGRHRRLAGAAVMYQDKDPNSELEPRAWAKHSANAPRRANPLKF